MKINVLKSSVYLLLIYLFTFIIESPLRYGLNLVGLDLFIYLRDILLVGIFLLNSIELSRNHIYTPFSLLSLATVLLFYSIIGFGFTGNIVQVIFALKLFIPFLLAVAMYRTIFFEYINIVKKFLSVFFLITIIGLITNFFVEFPWQSLTISIGDVEVEGSRNWTTFGLLRPAGFARTSFNLAGQILLLGIFVNAYTEDKNKSIIIWIITGIGVALTTTKGLMLSYLIITVAKIIFSFNLGAISKTFVKKIPGLLLILMTVFPLIMIAYGVKIDLNNFTQKFLFSSFKDRIENIWPSVFELLTKDGSYLFGRGLGGIGTAQSLFEPKLYVSPDNLFLYLFAVFGLLSVVIVVTLAIKLFWMKSWRGREKGMFYNYFIVFFSYGIFSVSIENPFYIFFVGLSLSFLFLHNYNKVDTYTMKFYQTIQ